MDNEEVLNTNIIFTDEEVGKILGELESTLDENGDNESTQEEDVVENLEDEFSEHGSESVGNEEPPAQQPGSPTPQNLFKSIAAALREEGVFPDADDESIDSISDAEGFRRFFDKQVEAKLNDTQKRISDALTNGVEPSAIQQYEGALAWLNQITEEALTAKNEHGEDLRRRIIYQDLLNRGYSEQRAHREIKKSLDAGTDIEDAKDAFASNMEYFQTRYNALLNEAKDRHDKMRQYYNSRAERFKKDLLENKTVFGSVDIDNDTRKRVFDAVTKPTHKGDDGKYYTDIQWTQRQDPDKFSRNVGLLYVLTDGFTNVEKLVNPESERRMKKGLAKLETVINTTRRNPDGTLNLKQGVSMDEDSLFDDFEGVVLDV